METSKLASSCQRPWDWCEPGQTSRLNILPELQTERGHNPQLSEPGSSPVTQDAGISPSSKWSMHRPYSAEVSAYCGNQGGIAGEDSGITLSSLKWDESF
jgi:hypothetical protein